MNTRVLVVCAMLLLPFGAFAQFGPDRPIISGGGGSLNATNKPVAGQTLFSGGGNIVYWDWATNAPATNIVLIGAIIKYAASNSTFIANGIIDQTNFSVAAINYISNLTYQATLAAAFVNDSVVSNGIMTYLGNRFLPTTGGSGTNETFSGTTTVGALTITNPSSATATMMLGVDAGGHVVTNGVPSGGGGSATNAIGNVYSNNVSQVTGATSIDFWNGQDILIGPITNRSGHVDVSFAMSSSPTNIASLVGQDGTVFQFGGGPFGISVSNVPAMPYYAGGPNAATNNTGLSPYSPWPMPYALTKVGGGVLNIMPGTNIGSYWAIGSSNSGLTIQCYGYPQQKWVAAFLCTNGASASIFGDPSASNVTIQGLQIYGNTNQDAIKCQLTSGWIIRDNFLHDNTGNGVLAQDTLNLLVERNVSANEGLNNALANHLHGFYLSGTNLICRGNVAYDNTNGWGFQFYGNALTTNNNNCQVYENLSFTNSRGIYIATQPGFTNYLINNTVANNINQAIEADSSSTGTTCVTNNVAIRGSGAAIEGLGGVLLEDYNIVGLATNSPGTHDIVSIAPGFVNFAAGLYWLQLTNVGIGKGFSGAVLPVDFFGNLQSTNGDIGFVQYAPNWKSADVRKLYQAAWPDYWEQNLQGQLLSVHVASATVSISTNYSPTGIPIYTYSSTTPTNGGYSANQVAGSNVVGTVGLASNILSGVLINPANAGLLTNVPAGSLTGGVYFISMDGSFLWPGDTLAPTWTTNTPSASSIAIQSAGPTIKAWSISQTASNRWLFQFPAPENWDFQPLTLSIGVTSGTNSVPANAQTNVWAAGLAVNGTAIPTMTAVTNKLPSVTGGVCSTNFDITGLTVAGTITPGCYIIGQIESRAGNTPWSSTNLELLTYCNIRYTGTNAQNGSITRP